MSSTARYRFAATVFVGVTLLLLLATGPTRAQGDRSGELQQMVNDLVYQLELIEQFDRSSADQRLQQLAVAMDRWNTSTRNHADFQAMRAWLEAAIEASLPGKPKPMPELPWFPERLVRREQVQTPQPSPRDQRRPGSQQSARRTPQQPRGSTPAAAAASPNERGATPQADAPVANSAQPTPGATAWQRHPAAESVDLGDPFTDDPQLAARSSTTSRVAMRPATRNVSATDSDVDINVAELEARTRGYVRGLRAVEARLLASRELSATDLLLAVRELQQLARQREFVEMYLDALPDEHRHRVRELPSTDDVKALVAARIEQFKQQPPDADQLFDDGQQSAIETVESMLSTL